VEGCGTAASSDHTTSQQKAARLCFKKWFRKYCNEELATMKPGSNKRFSLSRSRADIKV
jgi:hypothetical protein